MRNSFNFLLVALIVLDSLFLVFSFIDVFRSAFFLTSGFHLDLFPYFLFPAISITMTGSVYMTVAIALERSARVSFIVLAFLSYRKKHILV